MLSSNTPKLLALATAEGLSNQNQVIYKEISLESIIPLSI